MITSILGFAVFLAFNALVLALGICKAAARGDAAMEEFFKAENRKLKAERGTV